jgi:hypothetical protein
LGGVRIDWLAHPGVGGGKDGGLHVRIKQERLVSAAKRRPAVILIDPTTLDDETKSVLRAKARATIAKEVEEKTADALYQDYLEEERRALNPQEEIKWITLDLAGHSDRITLDGTIFFHGMTRPVRKAVYDSLRDIVARGWEHESEIGFANRGRNISMRPQNRVLSPANPTGMPAR